MSKNKTPSKPPRRHSGGSPKKNHREKFRLMAFKASPQDQRAIREKARAAGLTISAYIRQSTIEKTA